MRVRINWQLFTGVSQSVRAAARLIAPKSAKETVATSSGRRRASAAIARLVIPPARATVNVTRAGVEVDPRDNEPFEARLLVRPRVARPACSDVDRRIGAGCNPQCTMQ